MADPLSIIGVTATAITTTVYVVQYLQTVKQATKDREKWTNTLVDTEEYLKQLKNRLKGRNPDTTTPWVKKFMTVMGLVEADIVEPIDLETLKFNKQSPFGRLTSKLNELKVTIQGKRTWHRRVLWRGLHPGIKQDVADIFAEIDTDLRRIVNILQLEHLELSEATLELVWEVKSTLVFQQQESVRKDALNRLSKLDFVKRQNTVYGTCFQDGSTQAQWFLGSEEFVAWRAGRPWPLYCHGKPGAGKTVLSSIVVKDLEGLCRRQGNSQQYSVLCLYLDHKETKDQTYSSLIRSVLRQLLSDRDPKNLCAEAQTFYEDSRKDAHFCLADQDVIKILQAQLSAPTLQRAYLVVDALDEYPEKGRAFLLTQLQRMSPEKLSLFVTSRDFDEINEGHIQCMACPVDKLRYLALYFECSECPKFHLCQECRDKEKACRWGHELREPRFITKEIVAPDSEIERFVRCVTRGELGVSDIRRGNDGARTGTIGATRLSMLFPKDPGERDQLICQICSALVRTAEGMFLLAKLHLDLLISQPSLSGIRRSLTTLSAEVGQTYKDILKRIHNQNIDDATLAMRALAWVVLAQRPLRVPELVQIMAVECSDEDLLADEQTDFSIVMRVTMGLLVADGEQGPVRIVHRTAQEYFDRNWEEIFPQAQVELTTTMLAYLNFTALSSPCVGEQEDQQIASRLQQHSFYTYACTYWGYHVHDLMHEPTIRNRTFTFLKDRSRLAATVQAAWYVGSKYQSGSTWPVRHGVDAVHLCAWFGLDLFIATLLDQNYVAHIDIPDVKRNQTPLMYACVRGHVSTALALLQLGANINHVDREGNNAISAGILSGYPEVVEHMLMQDTISPPDLNAVIKGQHARTAVMLAVQGGLEPLLTALVRKPDIDVNIKDSNGDTALTLAAAKASTPIVKTLLEYADINVPNAIGSTALIIAAEGGKGDIVRVLLERNANWKLENHDADTAFSKGIIHGHTGIVKMLLSHGAGSDTVGGSKRTALHIACASEKTKPETIEVLLQEGLQMNSLDECRRTPLHDASRIGNFNAAKTLLDSGANQFVEDCHGRTPLLVAWQNGKSDLASLLQESAKQSVPTLESLPGDSSLPLWSMAKLGRLNFIRSTLRKQNVDLQQRDPDTESTALHCAIRTDKLWTQTTGTSGLSIGHRIAETLLKGGVSTQAVDDHQRTPLHIAAYLGNYEATVLLLAYNADPNVRSSWDLTPLSIAQSYKDYFLAVKLLEAGAAVEQGVGQDLQETFCAAVQIGVSTVAEKLLGYGVDLEGRNAQGQTVVELARASGDDALLAWLRKLLYDSI